MMSDSTLVLDLTSVLNRVHGFLSLAEAEVLYRLASEVPAHGIIIEIGSYQGRSTVCLGLGAKQSGAEVYAIDPHDDYEVNETVMYGMENHAALLRNLVDFEVADVVRVVALRSLTVYGTWYRHNIDLLWIDGCHDYSAVHADLFRWANCTTPNSAIALHDSSGHYPDVTRALTEFLALGRWVVSERVDATTVLRRIS